MIVVMDVTYNEAACTHLSEVGTDPHFSRQMKLSAYIRFRNGSGIPSCRQGCGMTALIRSRATGGGRLLKHEGDAVGRPGRRTLVIYLIVCSIVEWFLLVMGSGVAKLLLSYWALHEHRQAVRLGH